MGPPHHRRRRSTTYSNVMKFIRKRAGVGLLACVLIGCGINMVLYSLGSTRSSDEPGSLTEGILFWRHWGRVKPTRPQRLGVVMPSHVGHLHRVMRSVERWPRRCSPVTVANADLLLYYARGPDEMSAQALPILKKTGGRCFANTRVIFGNLTEQENVYPKGPSVQFYKMFLDPNVRRDLADYDALAIIEWDVLVAHESSFERLYHAAFSGGDAFWVKGSALAGPNFHGTAAVTGSWHVLGHLNGNAIYNNTDPAFVEFVNFTLARWDYDYSYDVALWATIADFPYSWPLWQRFSRKFVPTNLIANVGFMDVDNRTVANAVAAETLFIHGSRTSGGGMQYLSSQHSKSEDHKQFTKRNASPDVCTAECGKSNVELAVAGQATVCDRTCDDTGGNVPRFDGFMCGAGDISKYGSQCRLCFLSLDEAREAEMTIVMSERNHESDADGKGSPGRHVIMCDTLRPPPAADCSTKCARKLDTGLELPARQHADSSSPAVADHLRNGSCQHMAGPNIFQAVCDGRCGTGHLGDYNCNWRNRGPSCRYCFDNLREALNADDAAKRSGGRVIMCDTHEPPVEEDEAQQAVAKANAIVPDSVELEQNVEEGRSDDLSGMGMPQLDSEKEPLPPALQPFTKDILRGEICAFVSGYHVFLAETVVAARSIHHFMPGMRMVVAAHPAEWSVFNRSMGSQPGVTVVKSNAGGHSALLADRFCGEGTKLIFYMNPGQILSRTFTSKDTHGTNGDLLVSFTESERVDVGSRQRVMTTSSILGFASPSFTYGTDLILPAEFNQKLRRILLKGPNRLANEREHATEQSDEDELAMRVVAGFEGVFVPEVLAALAYKESPSGIWFLNPQQWVTHHMFVRASIWDIPLVKPRFSCSGNTALSLQGYDIAAELDKIATSFSTGGACESGYLLADPSQLSAKANVEFGEAVGNKPAPLIDRLRVSVMYMVAGGDAGMLNATIPTVIENFPGALEIVIVVSPPSDQHVFEVMVADLEPSTSTPIVVVPREATPPDDPPILFPLSASDVYCNGDFVLHLNPNSVLLQPITYERIFHFSKPVLPFTRLADYGGDPEKCWRTMVSTAMGVTVAHEFYTFDNHVYPVTMYKALRSFLTETRGASLKQLMFRGACDEVTATISDGVRTKLFRQVMEYSLMATFLWLYMHDSMHWRALDPRDVQPDEWLVDVNSLAFSCKIGVYVSLPKSQEDLDRFATEIRQLRSVKECEDFSERWIG